MASPNLSLGDVVTTAGNFRIHVLGLESDLPDLPNEAPITVNNVNIKPSIKSNIKQIRKSRIMSSMPEQPVGIIRFGRS